MKKVPKTLRKSKNSTEKSEGKDAEKENCIEREWVERQKILKQHELRESECLKIVNEKLPVRETEKETNDFEKKIKIRRQKEENKDYRYVEDLLRDKLDTKVKIKDKKIEISFNNVADLNRILEIIDVKE